MTSVYFILQWTVIFAFTILLFILSAYKWKNRRVLSLAKSLPTIESTLPVFGHIHHFFNDMSQFSSGLSEFMIALTDKANQIGVSEYCFWAGPVPQLFILNPDDIQVVLNSSKTLDKGAEYDLVRLFLGEGLLTSPGTLWKPNRKHVQPLFLPRKLEQMTSTFNSQGRQVTAKFSEHVGLGQVDVLPMIQPVALCSVCRLLFGTTLNFDPNSKVVNDFNDMLTTGLELWTHRLYKFWLRWDFVTSWVYKKEIKEMFGKALRFTEPARKILNERLESCEQEETSEPPDGDQYTMFDAFTNLVQSHPCFEGTFHEQVLLLCAAGMDTNSITLSSCLFVLALHPEIQEKLYKEIVSVMGNTSRDVTEEDLNKMPYLERVLLEGARRYSVAPFISRRCKEDLKLSFGVLPAGSTVRLCIYGVHMNPKIYPDPLKFDPDRFLPEKVAARHKFAHIPFSAGRRMCLGRNYAMLVMKITTIHVLREFKLTSDEDFSNNDITFRVEMLRKNGYPIKFERRH